MHQTVRMRERMNEIRVGCIKTRLFRSLFGILQLGYSQAKPCSSIHASLAPAILFSHASDVMIGPSAALPLPFPIGGALLDRSAGYVTRATAGDTEEAFSGAIRRRCRKA